MDLVPFLLLGFGCAVAKYEYKSSIYFSNLSSAHFFFLVGYQLTDQSLLLNYVVTVIYIFIDCAIVWCGIKTAPYQTSVVGKKPTTPHCDEFWKLERNDKNFGKK